MNDHTASAVCRKMSVEDASPAMERRSCPLCGARALDFFTRIDNANFSHRITSFDILRCHHCELAIMDPPATQKDLDEIYLEHNVFSTAFDNPNVGRFLFPQLERLYARYGLYYHFVAKRCLHLLSSPDSDPTILDVGCSTGRLLAAFKALRPEASLRGIDIDPNAAAQAEPSVRDHIMTADVFTFDPDESCDIITMCFIIEHLPDFQSALARVTRHLRPGGILCLSTPDLDSAHARQMKSRWRLLDNPRQRLGHLCWFNRRSLTRLAREHGLEILDLRNRGELLHHLPRRLQRFMIAALGTFDAPSGVRFIRNYQLRMCWAIILDGLLSQRLSYGDSLFAFLRKPNEAG
jgi:2-polyprenyl-3-methyl-5-hydroxy-6-metoxy-1,4-benzoquinol methylase